MDPNANLDAQERILVTVDDPRARVGSAVLRDALVELRDLRADLHAWLQAGGFPPTWARCPLAARYFSKR